jgi:hypothetical protein
MPPSNSSEGNILQYPSILATLVSPPPRASSSALIFDEGHVINKRGIPFFVVFARISRSSLGRAVKAKLPENAIEDVLMF